MFRCFGLNAVVSQFDRSHFSVNMTEIMYSLVNANRDDCRARLVCEFEVLIMRSPFVDYFTRFVYACLHDSFVIFLLSVLYNSVDSIRHGITRSRLPETGSRREDCTELYTKCVDASSRRTTV